MKKIISLLSVFAMIATMFTTVAFADENNKIYWEEVEKTATSLTLKLVIETDQALASSTGSFDLTDAIAKGLTNVTGEAIEAATWNPNVSKAVLAYAYTNVDGATGKIELGTFTFDLTGVTGSFTLPAKKAFTAKDTAKANIIGSFTNTAVGYEVVVGGGETATIDSAVAGNDMYGMKTALTKIGFKNVENPVVRLYKDGVESEKSVAGYELPANVKGNAEIIGIIRYAADVTGTFVLKVFDGANEVVSATYVAE